MELNETQGLPPHHAPTSLRTLLLIFGVLVVVALGYLVWAQNSDPDATDYSATSVKKTETETETAVTDETADWKTYAHEKNKFSIKYPPAWTATVKLDGENGSGMNIVVVTLKSESGESFELTNPEPGRGYEAWVLSNEKRIKTATDGLSIVRKYGPSTAESELNNFLYFAFTDVQTDNFTTLAGQVDKLPTQLIDTLDKILATFKFL